MRLTGFLDKYRKMFMSFATTDVVRIRAKLNRTRMLEDRLCHNILTSSEPGITDTVYEPGRQLIVSLTSYGNRLEWCCLAIESIMEQTAKANRIILWLDHSLNKPYLIPASLRMLEKRGLEIRFTEDIGPATKLIPALNEFPEDIIINIDDDMIYLYNVIDKLLRGHMHYPEAVISDWEDSIGLDGQGNFQYTINKKYHPGDKPSMLPVALGVAGTLYPPHSMHNDVYDIRLMKELSPKADDLWFKTMQLRVGTPVYCTGNIFPHDERLFTISHIDNNGSLYNYNIHQKGNEKQLAKLRERYPEAFEVYEKATVRP